MTTRRRQLWLLLVICVLTAVLEIFVARRQTLWADEVFSLAIATGHSLEHPAAAADPAQHDFVQPDHPASAAEWQQYLKHDTPAASPRRVLRAVFLSDTSPPLYYLLLYGWTFIFGTSDFILRLFSICFSVACVPLIANVARRSLGPGAVLPACILFAISPLAIYYGTEVRMYSLLLFCVLTLAWVSLVLQRRRGGVALHLLWIVTSAAGFLIHYFFLFPWLGTVLFLLMRPGQFKRHRLLGSILVAGLLIAPWFIAVWSGGHHWRVTEGWLTLRPQSFQRLKATRNNFLEFFSSGGSGLWKYERGGALLASGLFALLAGFAIWRRRWRIFAGRRLLLWLWFLAACAAPSVMDLVQGTFAANSPRYALAALPAAYILAADWLGSLRSRTRWTFLLLIAIAWTPPLLNIYRQTARNKQPFRDIARAVSGNMSSADLLLVHSIPSGVLSLARYSDIGVPIASWVGQLRTQRVPDSLRTLSAARKRIFFVKIHEVGEPALEEEWLRTHALMVAERRFDAARVIEFHPRGAETF